MSALKLSVVNTPRSSAAAAVTSTAAINRNIETVVVCAADVCCVRLLELGCCCHLGVNPTHSLVMALLMMCF
jgi:hypothetical protein